tara:strand:+ start:662 stop:997 length:336 start_codon:yes stop_codon:yes gene_type:complete
MARYKDVNGTRIQYTAEEEAKADAMEKEWNDGSASRKLEVIKQLRLDRLQSTDYMANSDYTMPDYIKTWRQSLRDIPANFTSESDYDSLLEIEGTFPNTKLKHTIWKQPTE